MRVAYARDEASDHRDARTKFGHIDIRSSLGVVNGDIHRELHPMMAKGPRPTPDMPEYRNFGHAVGGLGR